MTRKVDGSHGHQPPEKPRTHSKLKGLSDKVMGVAPSLGIVGHATSSLKNRVTKSPSISAKEAKIRPKFGKLSKE